MILVPMTIILIVRIFRIVDKTNTEIATFLTNIKYNDYAVNFTENPSHADSYLQLHGAFNLVTEKFRNIRSEKEAQFQYLQTIVENVDTGLLCFDSQGKTVLMNSGVRNLLHKSYFPTLESVRLYNEELFQVLQTLSPGQKEITRLIIAGQIAQISIRKTIFRRTNEEFHLFSLSNIHAELEEQEVASWQKLIRILTHEIMNSIAPVVSLSATAKDMIQQHPESEDEVIQDVRNAIGTINRRSIGLLKFTEAYRQLTKVPPPQLQEVDPVEIVEDVISLLKDKITKQQVEVRKSFPHKAFKASLDPDLIEQVLINLVLNALQAMENIEHPILSVSIFNGLNGDTTYEITDNGPGISEELMSQIFVPFFTTKKEGSGIGLSLCRQIIHQHKGQIQASSELGKGTTFTIRI